MRQSQTDWQIDSTLDKLCRKSVTSTANLYHQQVMRNSARNSNHFQRQFGVALSQNSLNNTSDLQTSGAETKNQDGDASIARFGQDD